MAGLVPIPTSRIPGLLARERLTQQMQADQISLFRLQDQVSTGRRIILPSDDAPSALRSIALQRLLERKTQLDSNISTGQSFLENTWSTLGSVATQMIDIKAATLGVVGNVTTEEERNTAIIDINKTLDSLVGIANKQFRGRYLFAGSQTSQIPFSMENGSVVYHGDDGSVQSYSDIGVLFSSNASGLSVFGGVSDAVFGSIDLNPPINENTLLSSLRGGAGIKTNGAFTISDGSSSSIIDVSGAVTVGDVKRLVEENVPGNRELTVGITGQGINLQFDPSLAANAGANLIVQEMGTGTTARELGIFTTAGVGTGLLTGQDLDPIIRGTTQLDDLLGTKARAELTNGGDNNDIQLEAAVNGTAADGVTVQFVDDSLLLASSGLTAGNEVATYNANAQASSAALTFSGSNNDLVITATTPSSAFNDVRIDVQPTAVGGVPTASYDSVNKVLTINLESDGSSDASQVKTAIDGLAEFNAALDTSVETGNTGLGTIGTLTQAGFGNTGNSGGDAKTLYVFIDPGATTANDVVTAIGAEGTFTAKLDPDDTTSTALAGTGLVDLAATATTSGGSGSTLDQTSGIRVVNGGQTYDITFENAENVNDLLNILNASDAGLQAEINASGSGINIRSRLSGQDFQIGENGGTTATQLGVRSYNNSTSLSEFNYGAGVPTGDGFDLPTIAGTDFTITTSDGINVDVDLSPATSLADVVTIINTATALAAPNVSASLPNPPGNVLELVENPAPGPDQMTVTQATGSAAGRYLGLIPDGLDSGIAVANTLTGDDGKYTDFTITDANGQDYGIDLSGAQTVGDVIAAINAISGNAVTAQLAAVGNGIELVDTTGTNGQLTVSETLSAQTAEALGLIPSGSDTASVAGTGATLTGTDRNFLETDSVFTTLIRLRDALEANDVTAVSRAAAKIGDDINRVTFARAEVGAREQGLVISQQNLQDEDIQLRSALSDEIDVDLIEAISNLTSRQVALEASLRVTASLMQLSLLNFI